MDFVSARELRSESAKVWEKVRAGEEMVVTRNGRPFALIVHVEPNEIEEKLHALRWSRFNRLLADQHKRSRDSGLDSTDMDAIDAEIAAVRKARRDAGGR